MALKIDDIQYVLQKQNLDAVAVKKILEDLKEVEEDNKASSAAAPKAKNQFVIVVQGTEETKNIPLAGWVVQIPEGEDPNTVLSRLKKSAETTVSNQKRKKFGITTVGQAMQYSKPKFTKENKLKIKTKEYVQVVVAPNSLNDIS